MALFVYYLYIFLENYCYKSQSLRLHIVNSKKNDILTSSFSALKCRLQRLAIGILGDSNDADDALQDAFCKLWARRENIKSRQEAEALSVTAVHNVCIDTLRRHSHSPTVSIDENRDTITYPVDDTESYASREELFAEVDKIITRQLTEQQQAILRMRDVECMSYEAIAESLNMQPTAVRMALSRIRKTIREIYLKSRSNDE